MRFRLKLHRVLNVKDVSIEFIVSISTTPLVLNCKGTELRKSGIIELKKGGNFCII